MKIHWYTNLVSVGKHTVDSGGNNVAVDNPVTVLISNVRYEVGVAEVILPSGDK